MVVDRRLTVLLAGLLATLLVTGVALRPKPKPPPAGAETFVESLLDSRLAGNASSEWLTLNAGQQAAISPSVFLACFASPNYSEQARWTWTVTGTRSDSIDLEGVAQHTSTEVFLTATFRVASSTSTRSYAEHAVWDGERWTWALDSESFEILAAGRCPAAGSGTGPTSDDHIT